MVYAYDAANRLVERTPITDIPLTYAYSYDAAGQATNVAISGPSGDLLGLDYQYDMAGNIVQIDSNFTGSSTYNYDALNRLTGINSSALNATYSYDAAGNRTTAGGISYTYDAGGRLVSSSDGTSYGYDAAGNLVSKTIGGQTTTYTWDGQNRLTRVDYPDGSFSAYQYDQFDRRISKRRPDGSTIYYVYTGDQLAQELNAAGEIVASYVYDGLDRPVSMWRGGETYFYLLDLQGSVHGIVDNTGVLTATYQYDPWGNLLVSTGALENPLRYTAREFDEESGLYYNRFRYYDPVVGRFISRDPIGLRGGTNLYSYVNNNSMRWRDPYGLIPYFFGIFRPRTAVEFTSLQSRMRVIMHELARTRPKNEPVTIMTDAPQRYAKDFGKMAGRIECGTNATGPHVRVQNSNGAVIAEIYYSVGRGLGVLAAIAPPLSAAGVLREATNGNTGPLVDSIDTLLGILMPAALAVNPPSPTMVIGEQVPST
jgi:RHS repeat-associated protein